MAIVFKRDLHLQLRELFGSQSCLKTSVELSNAAYQIQIVLLRTPGSCFSSILPQALLDILLVFAMEVANRRFPSLKLVFQIEQLVTFVSPG